eukprot:CAMPEP_0194132798 /NCGR_PEP_ID=MMETSP0152-20130528/3187_1 /TAXON_ID=1049557 /ORGANISM="Thalassiothrix antarctica, Strain L6-D1" /LENGTH=142 /DNA_ID=CAMNT_0038827969 /DNA_START=127 /DNA_END=555 /DNA_ORIENTATION=+
MEGNKEDKVEGNAVVNHPAGHFLIQDFGKNILTLPFLFTFMVLQVIMKAFFGLISSPFALFGQVVESNRQTNNILKVVPEEQEAQKHELDGVHRNQIQQREKLKELEERIHKIEERRAARISVESVPVLKNTHGDGENIEVK